MSFFARRSDQYKPCLISLMRLCEQNYVLLNKLLLNKVDDQDVVGDQHHFFVSAQLSYLIVVKEVTRYTTLVNITQINPTLSHNNHQQIQQLLTPTMMIRLYHDARMAEVNSSQHIRWLKPRYDYPNEKMHLPDEKQQVNQFLYEWLQLCLQQGKVTVPFLNDNFTDEN